MKKTISLLCLIALLFIAPFWMAIGGFIDGLHEVFLQTLRFGDAWATLHRNIWLKKASEK
jgi:hypothetical protein